jgi:hypothetical protein
VEVINAVTFVLVECVGAFPQVLGMILSKVCDISLTTKQIPWHIQLNPDMVPLSVYCSLCSQTFMLAVCKVLTVVISD